MINRLAGSITAPPAITEGKGVPTMTEQTHTFTPPVAQYRDPEAARDTIEWLHTRIRDEQRRAEQAQFEGIRMTAQSRIHHYSRLLRKGGAA